MICYDREFPESARALMPAGAEVVLVPNACEMESNRLPQMRARAYETLPPSPWPTTPGPASGTRRRSTGSHLPTGTATTRSSSRQANSPASTRRLPSGVRPRRSARLPPAWRHGANAFRRPSVYGSLTDTTVSEPFVRVDSAGRPFRGSARR
ncbi:hypothetical protein [Streptomyces sp. NRRL F-5123]|uniref:hypothetical protein n=1 Tax=Streptomyces sp. NRRL F-5123 TaxID=1463856 RepID=UPI002277419B|nr:hypothetical protein [Streptomyces sp. NRRL F-5123]